MTPFPTWLWTTILICGQVAFGFLPQYNPSTCRFGIAQCWRTTSSPFQQRSTPSSLLFSSTQGGNNNDDNNNNRRMTEDSQKQSILAKDKQSEYLAEARDPFSFIRIGIWSLLGLGGLVGTFTSVTGASAKASGWQNVQNTAINLVVTIAMVGALYLEFNIGNKGKEIVAKELENPMLKGNSGFFVDPRKQSVNKEQEDDGA